jgi:hypothetical protein
MRCAMPTRMKYVLSGCRTSGAISLPRSSVANGKMAGKYLMNFGSTSKRLQYNVSKHTHSFVIESTETIQNFGYHWRPCNDIFPLSICT